MRPIRTAIAALTLTAAVTGCAAVFPHAVTTSTLVTTGIERLKQRHLQTIAAIGDSARANVQLAWDHEVLEDTIRTIAPDGERDGFDKQQVLRIAATAADARAELMARVDQQQRRAEAAIAREYDTLTRINHAVTTHLATVVALQNATQRFEHAALGAVGPDASPIGSAADELAKLLDELGAEPP